MRRTSHLFLLTVGSTTLAFCLSLSCLRRGENGGVERVVVLGADSVDFGTVKGPTPGLVHPFTLENRTDRLQTVLEVKKGCGCLSAEIDSKVLKPGERCTVAVTMDASVVFGGKSTRAIVVFEDPKTPVVTLSVRAYVEPEYAVVISPRAVLVPKKAKSGTKHEMPIRVSEYLSHSQDYKSATTIKVLGYDDFRIKEVKPWDAKGWTFLGGYKKTTEIIVEYKVPEWHGSNSILVSLLVQEGESARQRCSGA